MATVTRTFALYNDGQVQFQLDYDDATLRVLAVRCINNSSADAWGEAVQEHEPDAQSRKGRKYEATFQAGTSTEIPIPTAPSQKLQLVFNVERQDVDGVNLSTRWPA